MTPKAGILKLLAGLDPTKAAGPDAIKPVVLRPLNNKIAPILQIIFQQSLNIGQIPLDRKKAIDRHTSLQKMVTNVTLVTVDPSH